MVCLKSEWYQSVSTTPGVRRYREALDTIPPPGRGCHPTLLRVANLGIAAGIAAESVFSDIRAAIPQGTRRVPDREILVTVDKAAKDAASATPAHRPRAWPSKTNPQVDGVRLRNKIIAEGSRDEADLWEASPVRLGEAVPWDALLLLDLLYREEDYLFIGNLFARPVRQVAEWRQLLKLHGPFWPHIMPNPVDGQLHATSAGTPSWRCDAAVCDFRFAVAEFDNLSRADQIAFWSGTISQGLVDVAVLIDSGGKSLHAWVRVDRPDRDAWECEVEQELFGQWLAPMGVDLACRNESRLSRLPGHYRADTGNRQRLLYFAG